MECPPVIGVHYSAAVVDSLARLQEKGQVDSGRVVFKIPPWLSTLQEATECIPGRASGIYVHFEAKARAGATHGP